MCPLPKSAVHYLMGNILEIIFIPEKSVDLLKSQRKNILQF